MTFESMARNIIGEQAGPGDVKHLSAALELGYLEGLRSCSWRMGGVDYLFDGPRSRRLSDVFEQVKQKAGPL